MNIKQEYLDRIKQEAFINELCKIANFKTAYGTSQGIQSFVQPLVDLKSGGTNQAFTNKANFGATNTPVGTAGTMENLPTQLEAANAG